MVILVLSPTTYSSVCKFRMILKQIASFRYDAFNQVIGPPKEDVIAAAAAVEDADSQWSMQTIKFYVDRENEVRISVRLWKNGKAYEVLQYRLLCIKRNVPKPFPTSLVSQMVQHTFHNQSGQWRVQTSLKLVSKSFWWPAICKNVTLFLKTCHRCQLIFKGK